MASVEGNKKQRSVEMKFRNIAEHTRINYIGKSSKINDTISEIEKRLRDT